MKKSIVCHCTRLRRASRYITRLYDETLTPSGLTAAQLAVMRAISRSGQASLTELASTLDLDRSTLGRNLRPLAGAGLVDLGRGNDHRARAVSLTGKGLEALNQAAPLWIQAQNKVETALGSQNINHLIRVIEELEEALQ